MGLHKDMVLRYCELQALLLAPIIPHWTEYIWREVLKKVSISLSRESWIKTNFFVLNSLKPSTTPSSLRSLSLPPNSRLQPTTSAPPPPTSLLPKQLSPRSSPRARPLASTPASPRRSQSTQLRSSPHGKRSTSISSARPSTPSPSPSTTKT